MSDTGTGPTWAEALLPDRRDLRFCTTSELTSMGAIERVAMWHDCTPDVARDRIGEEMRRRQSTTDFPKG